MPRYTVILLLPDDVAHNYGQDTICLHVVGNDPEQAITEAKDQSATIDDHEDPDAYFVIACFPGHLDDLNPET